MTCHSNKRKHATQSKAEYAMYKGDTFVDLGTADYLAEKYHKKKESLLYLARPVAHRKAKPGGTRVLLYRIED